MKIGIIVVYYVANGNDWILHKHLQHLAATEPFMDFHVYAAANRLSENLKSLIQSHHFVEIVDLPTLELRSSAEHGTYLDMLAARALADGCDYICSLDVDSWPISTNWIEIIYGNMTSDKAVAAAVLRTENGDTILPHPCFTFIRADLFHDQRCRYWINELSLNQSKFLQSRHQFPDTGVGVGLFLEDSKMKWIKLTRINAINYHWLMGGIYKYGVFHLGASSRTDFIFRRDNERWATALLGPLSGTPILWRTKPLLVNLVNWNHIRRNKKAFQTIVQKIMSDEQNFYAELLGAFRGVSGTTHNNEPLDDNRQ